MKDQEYEVVPVIPIVGNDDIQHTSDSPFCTDGTCGCHEDPILIAEIAAQIEAGTLTPQQATDIVNGRYV